MFLEEFCLVGIFVFDAIALAEKPFTTKKFKTESAKKLFTYKVEVLDSEKKTCLKWISKVLKSHLYTYSDNM